MPKNMTQRPTYVVVPCAAAKADRPMPAAELYTSANFALTLRAAHNAADDATVLILSAEHGLLTLDQVVAPYDTKMGDAGAIDKRDGGIAQLAEQARALGIVWEARPDVYAMLPGAYFRALDAALRTDDVYAADVYEAAPGIGYQRGVAACVNRTDAEATERAQAA